MSGVVAASAVLAWDYLITVDREIDLFWGKRWTATSALFFLNRYMVILAQVVNTYCKVAIGYWLTGFGMAQILLTEIIIYIRVCAMYTGRKQLHRRLLIFLILATIGSTTILALVASRSRGTDSPYPGRRRCTVTTEYGFLWAYWMPILAYEATMSVLVMRKVVEYLRERAMVKRVAGGWTSDLLQVILRDSVVYFVLMFFLFAGNGVFFGQKDPSLSGMLEPATFVLLALMGSRMLMNLREELLAGEVATTQVTTLGFAPPHAARDEESGIEPEETEDSGSETQRSSGSTSLTGPSNVV
ncbi:hypothetical protein AURDEDRAFT_182391 [Auricularia subglabra TFB-10046 SS5]|nr:hypothetical protein AURDEDRAFT_182391 [Auricularia subglabra TFB-10046 SS5]